MTFNGERHAIVNVHGVRVPPVKRKLETARIETVATSGEYVHIRVTQPVTFSKRVSRAVHKIAFELLCLQEGTDLVLHRRFDGLRDYVRYGRGSRRVGMGLRASMGSWEEPELKLVNFPPPEWIAELRLGVPFFVDLSPDSLVLSRFDPEEGRRLGLAVWDDNLKSVLEAGAR